MITITSPRRNRTDASILISSFADVSNHLAKPFSRQNSESKTHRKIFVHIRLDFVGIWFSFTENAFFKNVYCLYILNVFF
jgi:hypothetical protein